MNFKLIEEKGSLSSDKFHNHHLSLSISQNSVCYAVLDLTQNKYTYFKKFELSTVSVAEEVVALNALFQAEVVFSNEFKTVSCSFVSKGNTIVPESLYDDDLKDKYFNFNVVSDNVSVESDYLSNLSAHSIYGVLSELKELVVTFFPKVKVMHYSTVLTEGSIIKFREEKSHVALVNCFDGFLDLIILKEGKLQLQNTFSVHSTDDIAYFLLHTAKELSLSFEASSFYIYGNTSEVEELASMIKPYVRNIETNSMFVDVKYDLEDNIILENIQLFNQYRCV